MKPMCALSLVVVVGVAGVCAGLSGCGECEVPQADKAKASDAAKGEAKATAEPAAGATAEAAKADAVYVVRGEIVSLPEAGKPTAEFVLKHEPIGDFKNAKGEVVGMGTMEMPMPLASGLSLDGLKVGDMVTVTFADYYTPRRRYEVTKIEKLPADTKMNYGANPVAKPTGG